MPVSIAKLLFLPGIIILLFSCSYKELENTIVKKRFTSIESNNGNLVVHFTDNTTQSFSAEQVETLLKEKKIGENAYRLFVQKAKEAALHKQQLKSTDKADKESYPYRLNGRDVQYVEFKNGKFIIHMADKAAHTFLQHELDCMLINHIITDELYFKCMTKQTEAHISVNSELSFTYRKINCPEFN